MNEKEVYHHHNHHYVAETIYLRMLNAIRFTHMRCIYAKEMNDEKC